MRKFDGRQVVLADDGVDVGVRQKGDAKGFRIGRTKLHQGAGLVPDGFESPNPVRHAGRIAGTGLESDMLRAGLQKPAGESFASAKVVYADRVIVSLKGIADESAVDDDDGDSG